MQIKVVLVFFILLCKWYELDDDITWRKIVDADEDSFFTGTFGM
jgi:hypothetical protein